MKETKPKDLSSVIRRLITLVHNNMDDLKRLLEKTDLFSLQQDLNIVHVKRERCLKLLTVLQKALSTEATREIEGNKKSKDMVIFERCQTADKIMSMLKNLHFIEASELAEYLQSTLDQDNGTNNAEKTNTFSKEPRRIKQLRKVYETHLIKRKN
jgi:hypothetical protein